MTKNRSLKKDPQKQDKCFVADVSLLLHDPEAPITLGKHADVHVPFSAFTDLDRLYNSRAADIKYVAKDALEILEQLRGDHRRFNGGIEMLGSSYKLFVPLPSNNSSVYTDHPGGKTSSHAQVIALCKQLQQKYEKVTLVSKNKSLRLQAAALGVDAEDYQNDTVLHCYEGIETMDWERPDVSLLTNEQKIQNKFFVSKSGVSNATVTCYHDGQLEFIKKHEQQVFSIGPRNIEQIPALWALRNPRIKLVFLKGPAGCGKTFLALLSGIEALLEGTCERIIITRSMIPVDGQDLGALPGTAEEKLSPYMGGVWTNLETMYALLRKNENAKSKKISTAINFIGNMLHNKTKPEVINKIIAIPFPLIRGMSIANSFVILDESQNTTRHGMKTVLTRVDESTKMVAMGDNGQIDHPFLDARSNGFVQAINHFKGQPKAAHTTLYENERGDISSHASKM